MIGQVLNFDQSVCVICEGGMYSVFEGCFKCVVGFILGSGVDSCIICFVGFQFNIGQIVCDICFVGIFNFGINFFGGLCLFCFEGEYFMVGVESCSKCIFGFVFNDV